DRVMAFGFAYADGRRYDSGFFKDKTGMLCLTTGGTAERFSAGNVYGPIDQVLYPTQHLMVEYLGMKSHAPFVAYAAPRIDAEGRKAYLQQWRERVLEVAAAMPSAA
ncbi:MAG: NAD(P)H-dependent oxidoreductase, partial [Hyphomicrobium sp.]|nr:NAD(P)H-dependent oxidoreductase [Hyphomicrobium sp.]